MPGEAHPNPGAVPGSLGSSQRPGGHRWAVPCQVSLRDLRSFTVEHEFDAHSGSLSDFDVHGNLLVTCGFSSRMNGLACDRFLKVYDLRMMRATTPLQVHIDPFFLRFIPTYTSRLAIISQTGVGSSWARRGDGAGWGWILRDSAWSGGG